MDGNIWLGIYDFLSGVAFILVPIVLIACIVIISKKNAKKREEAYFNSYELKNVSKWALENIPRWALVIFTINALPDENIENWYLWKEYGYLSGSIISNKRVIKVMKAGQYFHAISFKDIKQVSISQEYNDNQAKFLNIFEYNTTSNYPFVVYGTREKTNYSALEEQLKIINQKRSQYI